METPTPIGSYKQSVLLFEKLKQHGVKTEFMTVKDGEHGKFLKEDNERFNERVWVFLRTLNL